MRLRAQSQRGDSSRCPYERLSQRLAELAERDGWTAHTERIEMPGNLMFGDLWNEGSTSRENPIAESVESDPAESD